MAGAGYKNWTAGDVPSATQFDTFLQEQTVMVFASAAARDTALSVPKSEGMLTYLLDTNTLTVYTGTAWSTIGPSHGSLTSYTPVLFQNGVIANTNNYSRYHRSGRLITGWFYITATTTIGFSPFEVTVSLPVAAAQTSVIIGVGALTDVSLTPDSTFKGLLQVHTTGTDVTFKSTANNAEDDRLGIAGTSFIVPVASGDFLRGSFQYEAAADA